MRSRRVCRQASSILILCTALLASTANATNTRLIYSFAGASDGEYTDTELVRDSTGNLYGTSVQGGAHGGGTVFQITPAGVHNVLYSFRGAADGGEPYKGVTLDSQGNLYGTTVTGGGGSCEGGCGVVFQLTNSGGVWTYRVIHRFTGYDGSGPGSPVAFDANGNLYGTTPTGGKYTVGVVYQLRPTANGWTIRVIHTFTGGADGRGGSAGRLLIEASGNLFGTCTTGGVNGFGTVYEISPSQDKWQFQTLYAFKDSPDGGLPYGGLVFDKLGNLYGTTYYAGAHDLGTVYKLTYANGQWSERVIFSFNGWDGASPLSTLVADAAGNFYGTTSGGGTSSCSCGLIFKLTLGASGKWTEKVVYRFPGAPGPGFAYNGMISGSDGNFFGATTHGGSSNDGAIYEFTP